MLLEVPALEQCSARAEMLVVDDGGTRGVIGGSGGGTRVGGEDDARDGGDASGGSAFARVRAALAMLSSGLGCFSTAASFVSQIIFVLGSIATISLRAQRAALTSSHEPPAASAYVQDFFRRVFDKLGRVASGRDLAQPGDGAVVAVARPRPRSTPRSSAPRRRDVPLEMVLRRSESDTSLPLKQQSGSRSRRRAHPEPGGGQGAGCAVAAAADRRCSLCQKAFGSCARGITAFCARASFVAAAGPSPTPNSSHALSAATAFVASATPRRKARKGRFPPARVPRTGRACRRTRGARSLAVRPPRSPRRQAHVRTRGGLCVDLARRRVWWVVGRTCA